MPENGPSKTVALNSAQILREARRLQFLVHPRALAELAGAYHGARPGAGLTFAELRPYEPGDDVRHIDWNVSARQQRPYVRHYTEERSLTLWLAVDLSASMKFGQVGRTKADRACQAAGLLAAAAIHNGDRVGLLLVGNRIVQELPPQAGIKHLAHLLRLLVEGRATDVPTSSNLSTIPARFGRKSHPHRALIICLSDFRDPLDCYTWRRLAAKHQCTAIRIYDPLEVELPRVGLIHAVDPQTGLKYPIDTDSQSVRNRYREDATLRQELFDQFCRQSCVVGWQLSTADDPLRSLQKLFREAQHSQPSRIRVRR